MAQSVFLKVLSAFVVGGEIAKAGEIVEVTESEAKNLLHRGKAEPATVEFEGTLAGVVEGSGEVIALDAMKKADLVALAADIGIDADGKTKAELVEAIQAEKVKASA